MAQKKSILVVEDDADTRGALEGQLTRAGYDVRQAADGEDGLVQIQKFRPDLVICDVVMPKMSGSQLLKKVRESKFGRDIPFMVLTAHRTMQDYFEVIGIEDFILKPYQPDDLLARVNAVFRKQGVKVRVEDAAKIMAYEDIVEAGSGSEEDMETGAAIPSGTKAGGSDKKLARESAKVRRKSILIAENDRLTYAGLQKMFSEHGYDTRVVRTLEECLEAAKQWPSPDLIILRYFLNDRNSELFANTIKELPELIHVPIVIYEDICGKHDGRGFILNQEGEAMMAKALELLH